MMLTGPGHPLRILCLACSSKRLAVLQDALKNSRYSAVTALTSEQAVALCVAQVVAAAVVDAESIRGQEWTVTKSLKAVRCNLPVILLSDTDSGPEALSADDVDAVVSMSSPDQLYNTIDQLVSKANRASLSIGR
jgi:DNA-binding NtrC family response regulator